MHIQKIIISSLSLLILTFTSSCVNAKAENNKTGMIDRMKIAVPASANRPVSFTNKEAAYYYTQTHENNHEEWSWFAGMNIAKERIFSGYRLFTGDKELDTRLAEVTVYPYKLVRRYGQAQIGRAHV